MIKPGVINMGSRRLSPAWVRLGPGLGPAWARLGPGLGPAWARLGLAWLGWVWLGLAWFGLVWLGLTYDHWKTMKTREDSIQDH